MTVTIDRFRAMGTTAVVEVNGDPALAATARARLEELEARWSRFLTGSDVSRCNATRGIPVFVAPETRRLVRHGIAAWHRTGGRCDPTVLDALLAAGYDRPFDRIGRDAPAPAPARRPTGPAPGCGGIEVDDVAGSVTLPPGVGFDPGAIGKGLAADIVVEELMEGGAIGAFVSLGGDLRAEGHPSTGDGWLVPIREPAVRADEVGAVALTAGAVATSTDRRRRWRIRGVERHHVIDPDTGEPAVAHAALVTTIAGAAWWAEALATQLMLVSCDEWPRVVGDDGAVIVDTDGELHVIGRMRDHLR